MKETKLTVNGIEISLIKIHDADYISLTDMVKNFGDDAMIYSWMRNRNTLEYIGLLEQMHNPDFKGNEFVTFKMQAGLNSFNLTPRKWIEATKAIGIISKAGRYGGGTLESINALLVHQGVKQPQRLIQLNETAITQMKSLVANKKIKLLK